MVARAAWTRAALVMVPFPRPLDVVEAAVLSVEVIRSEASVEELRVRAIVLRRTSAARVAVRDGLRASSRDREERASRRCNACNARSIEELV